MIEEYIDEVNGQLNIICESPDLETSVKYEFFTNTQKAFGRTALLLSGGAIFGLIHMGVIRCLHEAKLLPRIISGASVGSIIAAVVCTHTEEEVLKMLEPKNLNLVRYFA